MKTQKFSADQPFTLDVAVWWFYPPPGWGRREHVGIWWFTQPPQAGWAPFRVVYSRLGKDKARVDLVYPLGPVPGKLPIRARQALQDALNAQIEAALPALKVRVWYHTVIDLVYRAKDREEA